MSGIFGFSYLNDRFKNIDTISILVQGNADYGKEGTYVTIWDNSGIGYNIEHFSSRINKPDKVLQFNNRYYVIDALLYNRDELLISIRENNTSISDEELLARLIEEKGISYLENVNGDFAGAIYSEGSLTLFRDHMGVRPLYYYVDDTFFAFSTDLCAITRIPFIDLSINEERLYLKLSSRSTLSATDTDFQRIHCVRPASILKVSSKNTNFDFEESTYWEPCKNRIKFRKTEEYFAELNRLVTDAIDIRAKAFTSPVGGELSGGLDSSVIAIILNRLGYKGKFISWSASVDELPLVKDDERQVIADICKQENINCMFLESKNLTFDEILNLFPTSEYNTSSITDTAIQLRKAGVRGVFSGQGGDEGISHRCNIIELWYHKERLAFFKEVYHSTKGKKLRFLRTLKRCYRHIRKNLPRFLSPYHVKSRDVSSYLNADFVTKYQNTKANIYYFPFDPKRYSLNGGHRGRLFNHAAQGAKNDVRYLVPFLDYRVIDFALSIPRNLYLRKGIDRWIYRETFGTIMPKSLRKVNYKDIPSIRNIETKFDKAQQTEWNRNLLSRIDFKRWNRILDEEKIKDCLLQELTLDDMDKLIFSCNLGYQLYDLILIQNLQDNQII